MPPRTRQGTPFPFEGPVPPELLIDRGTELDLLARRGITGPSEVLEGDKGFMDAVAGYFTLDWDAENLERVTLTILKKYPAATHAQSAIDAVLGLRQREALAAGAVERWDGEDVLSWEGTYGEYLLGKVAKVFPDLASTQL